jgi:hypothetical protein
MPPEAKPFADVLLNVGRPSLSATTDMPSVPQADPPAEPVDNAPQPSDTTATPGEPGGEADTPPKEEGGEGKVDQTSPQQRAAFARERNKRQAAEARADRLESEVGQLSATVQKLVETLTPPPKEDQRPVRESFETPEAYDEALVGWAERRAAAKATTDANTANARRQQQDAQEATKSTYQGRVDAFVADHPDFEEVAYSADVKISQAMGEAIMEAEDGPAIAYWLGQNPERSAEIASMSPARAIVELGKISVRLSAPPPKAPPVIRPLQARNSAGPKDPNDMTMDEHAAWYAERQRSKKTGA